MSWGCAMHVGLLNAWESGCCSCWTTWPWFWVLRRVPHLLRNLCITTCRWIASEDNPADEPSRSKRCRPSMHSDVDQCGPSATGSAPDAELLAVLSAEVARVARSRFCAGVDNQDRGRMETGSQATRRKRACTSSSALYSGNSGLPASPLRRVVLQQNRVTAGTDQRFTATLNEFLAFAKMTLDELKLLAKLDEMLEHMYFQGYGHGAGDYLMAAVKFVGWIQCFSDLSRAVLRGLDARRRRTR